MNDTRTTTNALTTVGPAPQKDGNENLYQCLLSVNAVLHQDKFVATDHRAAKLRYSSVFLQNTVGDDIFDAIASKSGSKAVLRNEASICLILMTV
jgi:hypothetical protein